MVGQDSERGQRVVLIHDFLGEAAWGGLADEVSAFAEVTVLEVPPVRSLNANAWARAAHRRLEEFLATTEVPVDLVVGTGNAAGSAAEAAAAGQARHALLVNPDLSQLVARDPQVRLPAIPDSIADMLEELAPYITALVEQGTLPREGIEIMARHALGDMDTIPAELRATLRELAVDKFSACFPSNPAGWTAQPDPRGPNDWLHHFAASPQRCTLWTVPKLGLGEETVKALHRAVPDADAHVIAMTTDTPWLEAPRAFAEGIRQLITARA